MRRMTLYSFFFRYSLGLVEINRLGYGSGSESSSSSSSCEATAIIMLVILSFYEGSAAQFVFLFLTGLFGITAVWSLMCPRYFFVPT